MFVYGLQFAAMLVFRRGAARFSTKSSGTSSEVIPSDPPRRNAFRQSHARRRWAIQRYRAPSSLALS